MPTQQTLKISGMTCQACASRLEKVLNKKDSVLSAQVNFANETAIIELNREVDDDEVLAWVKKTGFTGQFFKTPKTLPTKPKPPYRLIALWVLSLPFWLGMAGMLFGTHALMPALWVQGVLATLAQLISLPLYRGAWASIRGGLWGMDVLIVLGTTAIWAYSLYASLVGMAVYFEAGVMILAFIGLGKYLEHRTKTGSLNALTALVALLPQTVGKLGTDKNWHDTPLSAIQVGDVLRARVGDKVATDGVVLSGVGELNQSHLTGESVHLTKSVGDEILAGSVVADGSLVYQATKTGDQTTLGQLSLALAHAQSTKAPIARLADRVAGVFVPCVVGLSVLAFLGNYYVLNDWHTALMRAISVLVIACPCALGLATPTAIMAGMGLASRYGVQFVDAVALENAGQIKAMAFDKTGTLTTGKPSVVGHCALMDNNTLFGIVKSLTVHSTHPLSQALYLYAKDKTDLALTTNNITNTTGQGIQGDIDGIGTVRLGKQTFVNAPDHEFIWAHADDSLVFVALDGVMVGVFALADTLTDTAPALINKLKNDNLRLIILSGDRQSVVDKVAKTLGIEGVGELTPQDKSLKIKELKTFGKTAMIGDGVNDALAMTDADLAMAVTQASDVASSSASVRLLNSDGILGVYYAHRIAKATLYAIKQNLFFAFIYNLIGIPLAIMGLLNPVLASVAMMLSSLSVLINALRLNKIVIK